MVEECTFDQTELTHKVNLFDMHHKYADVMQLAEVEAHLDALAKRRSARGVVILRAQSCARQRGARHSASESSGS